jgi:hypothetical protein
LWCARLAWQTHHQVQSRNPRRALFRAARRFAELSPWTGRRHVPLVGLPRGPEAAGLRTGDVTTAEIQDATPAVQVAHVTSRRCYGPTVTSTTCPTNALENGGLGSITEQLLNTAPR